MECMICRVIDKETLGGMGDWAMLEVARCVVNNRKVCSEAGIEEALMV